MLIAAERKGERFWPEIGMHVHTLYIPSTRGDDRELWGGFQTRFTPIAPSLSGYSMITAFQEPYFWHILLLGTVIADLSKHDDKSCVYVIIV